MIIIGGWYQLLVHCILFVKGVIEGLIRCLLMVIRNGIENAEQRHRKHKNRYSMTRDIFDPLFDL